MDMEEFVGCEKARGDCYRLLAACLYPPQKDVFLQDNVFNNLASLLDGAYPEASALALSMAEAFSRYSEEELNVDYARLFVGPNELLAPPYGSVYLDGDRRVMGDSTMEVIKFYEGQGLTMDGEFRNLPDHITVELEFMYYLIFKEVEALEKSDIAGAGDFVDKQELFLSRFLNRWIQPFCDKMAAGANSGFYRTLAGCTATFIKDSQAAAFLPHLPRYEAAPV